MKKLKSQSLSNEVKDEILKFIRKSYSEENLKLPTEEQFSKKLGVSRITIRTALNDLASDGFIFRRQGKGTFINAEAIRMKVPFAAVHMFMDIIALGGYKPGVRILPHQFIPAPAEIADKLRLQEGDTLAFAPKVFYASGTPCAYIEDYFDAKVLKNPEELEAIEAYDGTLFDYLNKHWRRRIVWDRTEIKTAVVEEGTRLAQELKENKEVKAVLLLDCVNFDQYDEPLIYAKEYVDTSYIQFNSIRYKKF